ncbi:WhiB family transcriptional regulator [Streptomyces sp. NPDC001941]|uniref:WhiB family transcriptional regulator n=1 Tax=Streptomyces sp. NPDC001941 TaxID=3154659 RepID=UPI0033266C28
MMSYRWVRSPYRAPDTAPEHWGTRAACAAPDVDPELFFPLPSQSLAPARQICRVCPVVLECLEAALAEEGTKPKEQRSGVRGGLSVEQRVALSRKRRRAAS